MSESKRVLLPKLIINERQALRLQGKTQEQQQVLHFSNMVAEDSLLHNKLKGQLQKNMNFRHFRNSRIRSQCKCCGEHSEFVVEYGGECVHRTGREER